jgi:ArsR family transcriptional regulator
MVLENTVQVLPARPGKPDKLKKEWRLDIKTQARLEARAEIIKAMAHPTRLFIIEELTRNERCVNELTEKIGADVSTVSKHLSVLKTAGIVRDEKRGAQVYYSLKVPCILNFFGCVESVLKTSAEERSALVK